MTCIAWDGRILAGDKQGDWGGTKIRVRKVFRFKDKKGRTWLMGGAGKSDQVREYLDYLRGKAEKPKFEKDEAPSMLLIDEKLRVYAVSGISCVPVRVYQKKVAVGSGRGEALGAMTSGMGAADAVRIASRHDSGCGMGVDVVRFA